MKFNGRICVIVTAVVLCLALLSTTIALLVSCSDSDPDIEERDVKRAILVLHGIMGGALIDDGYETPFWDPLTADIKLTDFFANMMPTVSNAISQEIKNGTNLANFLKSTIAMEEGTILERLQLNPDGTPVYDTTHAVAWDYDGPEKYGALRAYEELYKTMNSRYGEYYEVQVFQYDWRCDLRDCAKALEDFINEQGYEEVILCSHSMGNNVVNNYLARSQANRDKTVGYCGYAGPYYGATAALTWLENPDDILAMLDEMDLGSIPVIGNTLQKMMGDIEAMFEVCKEKILFPMASLHQLLPTIEMINELKCFYGDDFKNADGSEITTSDDLAAFYATRSWAQYEDGDGNMQVRKGVATLGEYYKQQYVTLGDGSEVYAFTLVDNYIFGATNPVDTYLTEIKFQDGECIVINTTEPYTDGTVPLAAVLPLELLQKLGKTYEQVTADIDQAVQAGLNYITYDGLAIMIGYDHFQCGNFIDDDTRQLTYEYVDSVIPKYILKAIRG